MYQNPQMQPMGGYYYQQQPVNLPRQNNILTDDEIKELQNKQDTFMWDLTNREYLEAICTHRKPGGMEDSLVDDGDGYVRCTICGQRFRILPDSTSMEEIVDSIEKVCDIVQTIKLMYVDLPASAGKDIYPIIPSMKKLSQLFQMAAKDAAKYETNNWGYNNNNMGVFSMLQNLTNFMGAPMPGMPGMAPQMAPGYGMPPQGAAPVPPMGAAPNMAAGYPNGAYNPFGFPGANQQPQGYTPGTPQGFAYTPGMNPPVQGVAQPQAPEAPAAAPAAETTVTQAVSV